VQPSSDQVPARVQTPIPVVAQDANLESVIGVMSLRKPKSFGRWDSFTGVVTNRRLIFAQMSSQMVKAASDAAVAQAKAEGKGFFGQWGDQLRAAFNVSQRYLRMQPSAILSETPGNFDIANSFITEIELKLEKQGNADEFEIQVKSASVKYEFRMDENSDYVKLLKQVYGEKVKMPFGYFSHGINIKL